MTCFSSKLLITMYVLGSIVVVCESELCLENVGMLLMDTVNPAGV